MRHSIRQHPATTAMIVLLLLLAVLWVVSFTDATWLSS